MSAIPSNGTFDPEPLEVPVDRPEDYNLVGVDLFCGGAGFSTGFVKAVVDRNREVIAAETGLDPEQVHHQHDLVQEWLSENVYLVGINHWQPAVETFRANHPWARVLNAKVQAVHPPDAVTVIIGGEEVVLDVDVVIAGPSCIPWSKANGGMAADDQLRMSPRHVAHWLEMLLPEHFLLENVEGIRLWGPPTINEDGEREMIKDGSMYEAWLDDLRRIGYTVADETFVAADYGDPQSRKRLFVMGRLEYEPQFPDPTHGPNADQPHRPATEILDLEDRGTSIWTWDIEQARVHSTPKWKTMRRVAEGLRRHCDDRLETFADALDWIGRTTDSDDDIDPDQFRDVTELREEAVTLDELEAAVEERDEPFLVEGQAAEIEVGGEAAHGLCVPNVLGQNGGAVARDATEEPIPTVSTGGAISLIEPETFVLPRNGPNRDYYSNGSYDPAEAPLHTVAAKNHDGHLVSPYLVPFYGERAGQSPRVHDVHEPLPTVPASEIKQGLVNPFLIHYYNSSTPTSLDDPVPTVTVRDRHALVVPEAFPWGLDIRFRMLKPSELKQAQGFPEDYELVAETKKRKTKLIGNAVPVNLAQSLCENLLEPTDRPTLNHYADGPEPAADTAGGVADDD